MPTAARPHGSSTETIESPCGRAPALQPTPCHLSSCDLADRSTFQREPRAQSSSTSTLKRPPQGRQRSPPTVSMIHNSLAWQLRQQPRDAPSAGAEVERIGISPPSHNGSRHSGWLLGELGPCWCVVPSEVRSWIGARALAGRPPQSPQRSDARLPRRIVVNTTFCPRSSIGPSRARRATSQRGPSASRLQDRPANFRVTACAREGCSDLLGGNGRLVEGSRTYRPLVAKATNCPNGNGRTRDDAIRHCTLEARTQNVPRTVPVPATILHRGTLFASSVPA